MKSVPSSKLVPISNGRLTFEITCDGRAMINPPGPSMTGPKLLEDEERTVVNAWKFDSVSAPRTQSMVFPVSASDEQLGMAATNVSQAAAP